MSEPAPVEGLSYEEAFDRLEALVASLEDGGVTLAEAVDRYERGMVLAAYCGKLLDEAELRVRELGAPTAAAVSESASGDHAGLDDEAEQRSFSTD